MKTKEHFNFIIQIGFNDNYWKDFLYYPDMKNALHFYKEMIKKHKDTGFRIIKRIEITSETVLRHKIRSDY